MTAEEMLAMRGVAKNAWGEEESRPYCKRGHSGQRATGIALGAVGVGLAILGIPLALVAAKAFASKAEAMANGNSQMIGETNNLVRTVAAGLQMESQNRENAIQFATFAKSQIPIFYCVILLYSSVDYPQIFAQIKCVLTLKCNKRL
jgi:hypothetical protein